MSMPTQPSQPSHMNGGRADLRAKLKNRIEDPGDENDLENNEQDPNVVKQVVKMPGPDGKDMLVSVKVPTL